METVHETKSDPLTGFRMRLEVTEQFAKVFFRPAEWNAMVRAGLAAGGQKWIAEYLPLRFTGYAISELKYKGKARRNSGHLPLVVSGQLRDTALSESWAEARATSSNAVLTLHIATGMTNPAQKSGASVPYASQPLVYQTLTTITEREIGVIAKTMEATIIDLIDGANASVSRKGTVRGSLTPTQRKGIAHTTARPAITHTQRDA